MLLKISLVGYLDIMDLEGDVFDGIVSEVFQTAKKSNVLCWVLMYWRKPMKN